MQELVTVAQPRACDVRIPMPQFVAALVRQTADDAQHGKAQLQQQGRVAHGREQMCNSVLVVRRSNVH